MAKIKLTKDEFGVRKNGLIELDRSTIDLKFSKGKNAAGKDTVVMHLTATLMTDDANLAIGETESDFKTLGAFEFDKPNFKSLFSTGFFLFIDPDDEDAVKLQTNRRDLVFKTNGKKRESGHALTKGKTTGEEQSGLQTSSADQ